MPGWMISVLSSLAVGLILFLLGKVTFKSSAEQAKDIAGQAKDIKALQEVVNSIKNDSWSTKDRVDLETRLVRLDERISRLIEEVDFTKTSHQEFLRLLERALIPVAHSPHTPELDALLEKRDRGDDLTAEEWRELLVRLDEQAQFYDDAPGKKIALKGLKAIYVAHLRAAQKKEGLLTS